MNQKAQYRGIFEASNDAFLIFDLKGVVREANPVAIEMYGYPYEEMIGLSGKDFVHPDYQYLFRQFVEETPSGKPFSAESVEIRKDGSTFNIEVRGNTFEWEGEPHLLAIIRDVTVRKRAEEALRESEEQLQALINAMPGFICFKDGDGCWLKVNDAGIRIFQLEGIDYRSKKDSELAELSSRLKGAFLTCRESDAMAWNNGGLFHGEEIISQSDGTVRVYDVAKVPVFHPDGRRKGLVVLGNDISERKKSEEEIRKLSKVVETTPEAVVVADMQGKIEYVNQGLLALGGYEDDSSIIGESIYLFSNEEGAGQLKEEIIPTVLSEGKWRGELTVKRRDSSMFPTEMVCSLISDE